MSGVLSGILLVVSKFSLPVFLDSIVCMIVCCIHRLLLPDRFTFGGRHEYKVSMIRNFILAAEFLLLYNIYRSKIYWFFVCLVICLIIVPNMIKIASSKKDFPELLIISSGRMNGWPKDIGKIKYEWPLEQGMLINPKLLTRILRSQNLDGIILHGVSHENARKVLMNRDNCKVLLYDNHKLSTMSINDTTMVVGSGYKFDSGGNFGVVLNGSRIASHIKNILRRHKMNFQVISRYNSSARYDAILDFTCMHHPNIATHVSRARYIFDRLNTTETPILTFTPLQSPLKRDNLFFRSYELLLQEYRLSQIIRIPNLVFKNIDLPRSAEYSLWCNIESITHYLACALSAQSNAEPVLEFADGEYMSNNDVMRLIEELSKV